MKKYYILLFAIIFLLNCSEKQPVEQNNDEIIINDNNYFYSVSGLVFEEEDGAIIDNHIITLEGDSLFTETTDNQGRFIFEKISVGSHTLSFRDSLYYNYDTNLTIISDTIISVPIKPIVIDTLFDYFPLEIGFSWNYDYSYYSYDNYAHHSYLENGKRIFQITSESHTKEQKKYNISVIDSGTSINKRPECLYCDTLVYIVDTSSYNHEFEFSIIDESGKIYSHPFTFNRYYKQYPDTIRIEKHRSQYLLLKKEIGKIYEYYEESTNSGITRYELILNSYVF